MTRIPRPPNEVERFSNWLVNRTAAEVFGIVKSLEKQRDLSQKALEEARQDRDQALRLLRWFIEHDLACVGTCPYPEVPAHELMEVNREAEALLKRLGGAPS